VRHLHKFGLSALFVCIVPFAAKANDDVAFHKSRYGGVDGFLDAVSKGDHAQAMEFVVPVVNGPGGHLTIPDPDLVTKTLLGCSSYGHKYAQGDFPLAIARWRCGDAHFSLWVRPSYDGQSGKIQIVQFGDYTPPDRQSAAIQTSKAQ
jgi:hypothetical protein